MQILRNNKGITLPEVIIAVVVISLIVAGVLALVSNIIDRTRGTAAEAEARSVYFMAQIAVDEIPASDWDYMQGLNAFGQSEPDETGSLSPEAARVYDRFKELLEISAAVPEDIDEMPALLQSNSSRGTPSGTCEFTVENGIIQQMIYTLVMRTKTYTVTITYDSE